MINRPTRSRPLFSAAAGALLAAAIAAHLPGCADPNDSGVTGVGITDDVTTRDPKKLLAIITDPSAPDDARQKADRYYIQQRKPADPPRLAALESLLFLHATSDAMRVYALDQILAADPARAVRALTNYLPRIPVGPALDHACQVAIQLKDPHLTAALIQSLDRPGKPIILQNRPEVAAIESITGQPFSQGLESTFISSPDATTQLAALALLRRIRGDDPIKQFVTHATPWADIGSAADIAWYAGTFDELPSTAGDLAWLKLLRQPANSQLVQAALQRHTQLKKEFDYHFALRFVGLLAHLDDTTAALSRQQLIDDLQTRLSRLAHIKREPKYALSADDTAETLDANAIKLTRCDLLAMRTLLIALEDPRLPAALIDLGLKDRADTTTEHGGLLQFSAAGITPLPYPPQYHNSDFQYAASDQLAKDAVTGLAQYHFHFQKPDNEAIAGPGIGDLEYAKTARCSAVVFTSVRGTRFDVDYYTPEGAVVDLGVWPK